MHTTGQPEFDGWKWHEYWATIDEVINFKQQVYERALTELSQHIHGLESMGEYHARRLEQRKNTHRQEA